MAMFGLVLCLLAAGVIVGFVAGCALVAWGVVKELESGSMVMGQYEYRVKAVVVAPKRQPPASEGPTIDSVLERIREDLDREGPMARNQEDGR